MTKDEQNDPANLWDVVTVTTTGDIVWQNYERPRRIIIAKRGEDPRKAAAAADGAKKQDAGSDQETP